MVLSFYCRGWLEETGSGSDRVVDQNVSAAGQSFFFRSCLPAKLRCIKQISYFIDVTYIEKDGQDDKEAKDELYDMIEKAPKLLTSSQVKRVGNCNCS